MTRFATFAALYMAAVLLELGEHRRPAGKNRLPVPAPPREPASGGRVQEVDLRVDPCRRHDSRDLRIPGREHATDDIVNDPVWRTPARDWEMRLMDFRVIQEEGPSRCRW